MNISQAAAETGLSTKTIRFYEAQGVIPPANRAANGYRIYSDAQLEPLRFIKRARDMGFTLEESRELLMISQDPGRTSAEVKQRTEQQIERIDQQIASLRQMRAVLVNAAARCRGDNSADCPILDELSGVTEECHRPE